MRTFVSMMIVLSAILLSVKPGLTDDKELQNQRGSVAYQKASTNKPKPIAKNATVVLNDSDYAITGKESLAAVGLPDSSRVLVGSESKIQLSFFNQAEGNNAKFIVYNGRVRFTVQHPAGAQANYIFQTATGTVGVRGTQGDIAVDNAGTLRVNVYEVCDPNLPVTVTTKDGKVQKLLAGQTLLAQVVNGIIQTKIEDLTQQLIDQFSPDFGVPTSWDDLKSRLANEAQSRAGGALDNATGGMGGQVVSGIGGLFKHKSAATPTPEPSAASASCSHN